MPPESARNKNLRVLREGIKKNKRYIGALNRAFNERLQQQQQNINNLKNAIGNDNKQRDQNISEISHNLALLKSFVTEKLSNHTNDYEDFVNHQSSQPINNSIVPIQGGRRKTRKRKTRRKKGGTRPNRIHPTRRPDRRRREVNERRRTRRYRGRSRAWERRMRRSNRVYPNTNRQTDTVSKQSLWRDQNNDNSEIPLASIVPNSELQLTLVDENSKLPSASIVQNPELPLAQEVVVAKVRETPRQYMINLAKKCKNKFDKACRTVKRIAGRELSGSGSRKRKKQNKKHTKRRSRILRKTIKKKKKGGEYSELAKNTIRKNASRYPKLFHSTIEKTNPSELIRKRTPKVYPRKGPGIGGKRKRRKRKTHRKRK